MKHVRLLLGVILSAGTLFAGEIVRTREVPESELGLPASVAVGDLFSLKLFNDVEMTLTIVAKPPAGIAGQSFIAKDESGSASAIVKFSGNTARISIDDFMNRRQYTVRVKNGTATITERDNSQMDDGECGTCGGEIEVPQPVVEETKTTSTKKSRTLLGASGNEFPLAAQKSVVDILVAFDQGAKAKCPLLGYETIEDFADYAVGKMNTVLANSQLDDKFCYRLVGVTEIDDSWTMIDNALLLKMRAREGKFANLEQLRDKYGADTITLLINRTSGNASGIGFEYSGDVGKTLEYFEHMKYGCNVCDINTVYSRYTMSHETGHNMGCGHSNRQGSNSGPGRYSDSCGYHFTDANNVKRSTVMAYTYPGDDSDYYDPIPYFSTPDISPTEYGCALGVEGVNNNRSTLLKTHADTAGLHEHVLPYDWDVKFLDDNGNEIPDGSYFYTSCDVTLTSSIPDSEIYYTVDGSTPTHESYHGPSGTKLNAYLVYGPKTITASVVTNGVALSVRSITLRDGLTWRGDENGYGVWASYDSSKTPWSGEYFDGDSVQFPDLAGIACATVMVQDAVSPASVWFRACETAYLFDKGSDTAQINFPDAAFVPAGDVTFNVPVKLNAVAFTNLNGRAITFNAPFGQTLTDNSGYCTNLVTILPYGKLTVAPGVGKTQTFDKLNNTNGGFSGNATFRVGVGTVVFKGAINSGAGVIGRTKLEVGNGGNLVFDVPGGGGTGYQMDQTSLTVENGGRVTYNDMELLKRTLYLDGGTIYAKRLDLMSNPGIYVTDNSAIEDNNGGYIYIRDSSSEINVSAGKTLALDIGTDYRNDTSGNGIIKYGGGTIAANSELKHNGVTDIEEGTLEVGYSSGSTVYGMGWTVASNSTLRVKSGCTLKVPSLTLYPTSIISLPAAISAPLVVNGNVDLTDVRISIQTGGDLSLGASYPLISATGNISGIKSLVRESWPKPGTGLGWKVAVSGSVLTASIVNAAESDPYVDFVTNIQTSRLALPSDATMTDDGGLKFASSPIAITSLSTRAFTMSLDVDIPAGLRNANQTICSWSVGGNIIRCVVTNGVLDCFHGTNGHTDNDTDFIPVTSGRHIIKIGYNSDGDYPGTCVYVDNTLAYTASGLKWGGKDVTRITVGATAADAPAYPYKDLILHALALANPNSTEALSKMTSSGGQVTYNYLATKSLPHVFALTPNGGFETCNAILSGAFSGTYDALSVSIVASFPEDATGAIISSAVADGNFARSTQVEYRGNGVLAFREDGSSSLIASVQVDADMSAKHLYTMTYTNGVGYKLYIDGTEVLANEGYYAGKNMPLINRVVFGCGYWTNWMTSSNDNPNPISNLKVYASHIALGTNDRTESEAAVKEATGYEPADTDEEDLDPEPPATPAVVDVLVAFDNGAQEYVANKSQTLEEFAAVQIGKMNDVLVTNKLDRFYSYRLAGTCKVDATYPKVESVSANLVSGAGPLVTLRAARELCGADTVTLLVKASGGVTLGDSIPLSHSTDVASRHDCAFSVCSISAVDTGTQHTMIHENAHNMGCGHARQQSAVNSPFEYGRGYYFKDGNVTRHTIMAYGGDNDASWYFSTASKEFGFVLGDKTNNNARVLKETCGEVAKWRDSVKPNNDELIVTDENGNEITADCFFRDTIKVTVTAPGEGAELYYTFEGADPTLNNYDYRQLSPFTFNLGKNRTIRIAYYDGEKLSPVRTINAYKCANVPAEGLWQTCKKYPWYVDGDGFIRSYNQTDYIYQCTTPLKATVVGPKRLSFKHKSYFGGAKLAGDNYSHFDVLVDDSPVFTQTECTNEWEAAAIDIPDGTHEVVFVFSQHFAMNNPSDNKNGDPEADDAVWLKDIALEDVQTLECKHSSTSDDVDWVFPYDYEATAIDGNLGGIEVGSKGVVETLNFSTNAVCASVLAELPENAEGAFIGLIDAKGTSRHPVYAYANGDGTVVIYFDDKAKTKSSKKSDMLDLSGLHVWTIAYDAESGARLYMDGEEVASDAGIMWTGVDNLYKPAECVAFGCDCDNSYPLEGMKIYAVHSDFGSWKQIFDAVSSSVDNVLSLFDCLTDYADETLETKLELLSLYNELGSIPSKDNLATECVLRISEIMPKPTDALKRGALEGMDVNGLESGWVEVENTSPDKWADLGDYKFIRSNRGKKTGQADYGKFPSVMIAPGSRYVFYTSERYSNSADMSVSAWAEADEDGVKPKLYGADLKGILVWPDKVNPKKSPFVRLIYTPTDTIVDTVVVPSDVPEGCSIIVGEAGDGEATKRWLCPTPTRGRANTATDGLKRIGPNAGPLYEIAGGKKHNSANEFARLAPPAVPGEDYEITFSFNPVMHPTVAGGFRDEDAITDIRLVYRTDLTNATTIASVDMTTDNFDAKDWGHTYTATIPHAVFDTIGAGHLIQWKFIATDASGNEWTSPSFNNPDDGYEWYGTIVEPDTATQMSATLPTWHMFADSESLEQMEVDASDQTLANNARVAIYDSSTSNYYDYVRIDLRGNTSAKFTKKSHGLRFAKAHPLTMTDVVTGETIEEIRKTSLISEFADPSYMRQMIAFWLWKKMGNLVPFDFPVRCNMNGEFYQLAFNSERFTDELIEDVYGLDKFGYGYKNVGTLKSGSGTTAGDIEKKTPDDEDEKNIDVLEDELRYYLKQYGAQSVGEDVENLTKFVVEKFDLPAWLNYLASARITQEMDDVWANVCAYYDNAEMKEGVRGTGTWMPLGYDFNLSFGQWYYNDVKGTRFGLMSNQDWYKSHPFYGGNRVRCWKQSGMTETCNYGNDGFEAVWQSAKFRRLYLRRLRTLMDQELKEPGTAEADTPFMAKMREMAEMMRVDATLDQQNWPNDSTDNAIDVWATRPADMDAGIDDIWNNYVVPRREHLYVTHSVTNTAKEIGYDSNLNAGIPESQSDIAVLAPNITITNLSTEDGYFHDTEEVVIYNGNDEVVDMSGWKLAFSADFTFPAGTVCDANDYIYIVADRRQYIEDHKDTLTDEVIVGNATITGTGPILLYDANGVEVFRMVPETNELNFLRLHSFYGNTLDDGDTGEWFTLTNISDLATLDLAGVTVCFLKQGDPEESTAHCHVTLENKKGKGSIAPLKSWTASQADYSNKGWEKIQNNKQQITIYDKYGSVCQSLMVTQKSFKLAYGKGGYLVCDSINASVTEDSQWHEALPNNGKSSEPFDADSQEAADELVANAKPALTQEDAKAELKTQYLKVVAEPVEGSPGKYKAAIVVNPATVEAPIVAGHVEEGEPVEVEEDDKGKTTVSVSISNAIQGLWYGYEVSDALGEAANFANDVGSFERAKGTSHTVKGSSRDKPSGFFRIKVLPAKPSN